MTKTRTHIYDDENVMLTRIACEGALVELIKVVASLTWLTVPDDQKSIELRDRLMDIAREVEQHEKSEGGTL